MARCRKRKAMKRLFIFIAAILSTSLFCSHNGGPLPTNYVYTNFPNNGNPVYSSPYYTQTNYQQSNYYTNEVDKNALVPTYYSSNDLKSRKREQKVPLISNNNQESKLIEELYKDAIDFIDNDAGEESCTSKIDELSNDFSVIKCDAIFDSFITGSKLVKLIQKMNTALKSGIDEDSVKLHAYNQSKSSSLKTPARAVLLFSLLKKYRFQANKTKELLPFQDDIALSQLRDAKNLKRKKPAPAHYTYAKQFPAFFDLINDLYYAIQTNSKTIIVINSYMHSNEFYENNNHQEISSNDVLTDFYKKGFSLINEDDDTSHVVLFDLIQLFYKASLQSKNGKFENKILAFESGFMDKCFNSSSYCDINTKNRLVLLYTYIKQFCESIDNKIIPIPNQYLGWSEINKLDLLVSSSFVSAAFNEDQYALIEFMNLLDNIDRLKGATDQKIKTEMNHFHPQLK